MGISIGNRVLESFFQFLSSIDSFFWGYVAFVLIIVLGSYLTIKNSFFQIRQIPAIIHYFIGLIGKSTKGERGVHPLKTFFASVGGMVGVGNIAGVVTAIQLGGPGALFWVWVTGTIGAIVKYSEIYLGVKYRVENSQSGYDGGPMYFLRAAFKSPFLPGFVAFLLCIYGVEIYQFSVITESVSTNWHINRYLVTLIFLGLVLYASLGGVKRVGQICSWVMPFFILIFMGMGLWILVQEAAILPGIFKMVITSAFTGHAAVGGFAGATAMLAIQYGIARAAYSADIGIGYDSIIQSESSNKYPQKQARLAILGVFIDNVISTLSILIVLVSGIWMAETQIPGSHLVQTALSGYFPHMDLFMPVCLTIVGFTTIIAYFCVGLKCATYLFPQKGFKLYTIYGALSLSLSAFISQTQTLLVMSIAGALLLIINLLGIFKLRREISFVVIEEELPLKKKVRDISTTSSIS
jgi:AGCS family alanine or glycine:cation symporter